MNSPTRWEWMKAVFSEDGPQGQKGGRHSRDSVQGWAVRLTLAAVAQHMDPSGGNCWPSAPTLAVETGLGERTVRQALGRAVEEGWISREARGRGYRYSPLIPAAHAAVEDSEPRRPMPESEQQDEAVTAAARAGVTTPAAHATAAAHAPRPRRPVPPSSTREVGTTTPSTSSPVSKTLPPPTSRDATLRRESVAHVDLGKVRSVLRDECLLGDDEGTLPDGSVVGIGLLLVQFADLRQYIDPEFLLEIIQLVRYDTSDPDDPPPGPRECFSLRWLTPERLSRLEGQVHKRRPPDPMQAAGGE